MQALGGGHVLGDALIRLVASVERQCQRILHLGVAVAGQADLAGRDGVQQRIAEVDLLVLGDVATARVLLPEVEDEGKVVDRQQLDIALHRARIVAVAGSPPRTAERDGHLTGQPRPAHLRSERSHHSLQQRLGGRDRGSSLLHLLDQGIPKDPLHLIARLGVARSRLGDGGGQAAEQQIALQGALQGGQMDARRMHCVAPLGSDNLGDGQTRPGRDRAVDRMGEGGETLRQDEKIVHGRLPAHRRGHLVEQNQPRSFLRAGQLERAVDRFDKRRGWLVLEQNEREGHILALGSL